MSDELDAAVAAIRERSALEPTGRGRARQRVWAGSPTRSRIRSRCRTREIPGWPVSTAMGHAGTLVLGSFGGVAGRGDEGPRASLRGALAPAKVVFGVRVLGLLGIRALVLTNACGAIDTTSSRGSSWRSPTT